MTVALGTNIANPISTALSQWLGFDTMGKLANYGKLGVTDPDAAIKALFANNEQGVFFNPSDLTTMFQDRAGTTPVTADGEPVGLILDKSKGLVLGAELVTNTGPFTNTTGWTTNQATLSVADGTMKVTATATGFAAAVQTLSVTPNTWHKINTVTNYVDGPVARFCALYDTPPSSDTLGNFQTNLYTVGYIKSGADGTVAVNLYFAPTVIGQSFEISSISIKEIAGNHAVAPSDAARPLYKTDGGLHWLQFDGVDDSLSTAAINFTATANIDLFSGARSAGASTLFSNQSSLGTVPNGSFLFQLFEGADVGAVNSLGQRVRGTAAAHGFGYTQTVPANVDTNLVVTHGIDLAGTTMATCWPKHRINGSQQTIIGTGGNAAPGGGAFGNLACSIGRVGVSLSLNGRIYSLIVLGRLATPQEITDTETWVAAKTGVTLP